MKIGDADLTPVLLLVGIGGPLLIAALLLRQHLWRRALREGRYLGPIAAALGSELRRDPSASMPFLNLRLQGLPATFSFWPLTPQSRQALSLLEISVGVEGFFEAVSWMAKRSPTVTTRITRIDVPSHYSVMTSDPTWGRRVLAAGVEDLLADLERRFRAPLRFQLTPSRVSLDVERLLDLPGARALIETGGRLLKLLDLSPEVDGISIVETSLAAENARCPVCGLRAEAETVACPVCRAPHHRDCRAYLGRCGIFGCRDGVPSR